MTNNTEIHANKYGFGRKRGHADMSAKKVENADTANFCSESSFLNVRIFHQSGKCGHGYFLSEMSNISTER